MSDDPAKKIAELEAQIAALRAAAEAPPAPPPIAQTINATNAAQLENIRLINTQHYYEANDSAEQPLVMRCGCMCKPWRVNATVRRWTASITPMLPPMTG